MPYTTVVEIPDCYSAYANFQYRLWFTWRRLREVRALAAPWLEIVSTCPWLWDEPEDEECIKVFAQDLAVLPEMPPLEWANACHALSLSLHAREPRTGTTTPRPLDPLISQTRLRFIAWLLVMALPRIDNDGFDWEKIEHSIFDWAKLIAIPEPAPSCQHCQISHLLPLWMKTMRQVYELDHLRLIPWNQECNCWESCMAAARGSTRRRQVDLDRDSPNLHVLYELVVPPWPLVCWVAFRTLVPDGTVQAFLDILRTADRDLLEWDNDDNSYIFTALQEAGEPWPYPQQWTRYMVEIDLQTWLQIRTMTWTADRVRSPYEGGADMGIRLIALTLKHTSTSNGFTNICLSLEDILIPLDIDLESEFDQLLPAVTDSEKQSIRADFASKEFWARQNLENWLSACEKNLVQAVWNTPNMSVLSRLRYMAFVLETGGPVFENLTMYTYCLIVQQHKGQHSRSVLKQFWESVMAAQNDDQFARCCSECDTILQFLRQSVKAYPQSAHRIALSVYEKMNRDIPRITAALVVYLQEPVSSDGFLTARETVAQGGLNLLQDLLDLDMFSIVKPLICKALVQLSRASGLHPRCFSIAGLQKIGQQVAGGGFGDIWKGVVRGQVVSVKVMRIFQEQEVAAALKEFSREALIWRQLCHPNLLPFFGLYYLDNRLCLVSPWMENGNIMQFLSKQSPNIGHRLSLILDVALGLQYLHEQNVVHGDLKAINILVTPSGKACICDFGLASIVNEITLRLNSTTTTARGGTARYYAPELFQENKKHFGSDVYALACVASEILSGKIPFHDSPNDMAVMFKILQGGHPTRPPSCSGTTQLDSLWKLLQHCWNGQAHMRPSAAEIVEWLVAPSIGATFIASTTDWDDKFTCKFRRSLQDRPLLPSVNQIERKLFDEEVAQACKECFPDCAFTESQEKKSRPYRVRFALDTAKRRHEELPDSEEGNSHPGAKRSRRTEM
ncbi:hypothetical protein C8F04DRAFT_1031883 [Mycena alexandri]|uniref:Protein kinase domain-containing protein n=1 Tax=Mycena alexandri TaxID=1745969 RepID=A0AAD6T7P7_9AGAR|nr:hypothetical protein C8F04DRAFT_1031883 [Mycena alexandri]